MYKPKLFAAALAVTALLVNGCANDAVAPEDDLATLLSFLHTDRGPNPRPQTWVDGELFDGVVTPATFDPASDPFDELYAGNGFLNGVPLISESKPGDQDYNGGRWHMNVLKADVVPSDKYANADRVEDLDLADFESTENYFECPLLPRQ